MKYFPISIDTQNKNILVIGGGDTAAEKIRHLLKSDFKIYCIADDFSQEVLQLSSDNPEKLLLKGKFLDENFVFFGYDYVIIATGDTALNRSLTERAKKSDIPFYRADNIGESTFRFNEIVEFGGLTVSILSEGISNQVLKQMSKDIENVLLKYDVEKLTLLNMIKTTLILRNHPDVEGEIEKLSKSNVAVIKQYKETLERTDVDMIEEFKQDGANIKKQKEEEKEKLLEKSEEESSALEESSELSQNSIPEENTENIDIKDLDLENKVIYDEKE